MKRCMGCGAILQSKKKEEIGYVPKEKKEAKLCERCFRLLHYNDLKFVEISSSKKVLEQVNKTGLFAFFLVDLLNINKEVLKTYHAITAPKCFIISKVDFIPKYMNKNKIKVWLREEYDVEEEIIFLSAHKNQNIHYIENMMEQKNITESYLLGYTNSGKSTLLNKIMEEEQITTSIVPNTTIDFIKISLGNGKSIIDTPGFLYQDTLYPKDDVVFIKKINPKTFLKPITFQLKKGASLLIEDLLRIENQSEKCNMTLYMSNLLSIKKVYAQNELLKNLESTSMHLEKNQDLVLKGIGFINFKSDSKVKIYIQKPGFLEIRSSFFGR